MAGLKRFRGVLRGEYSCKVNHKCKRSIRTDQACQGTRGERRARRRMRTDY